VFFLQVFGVSLSGGRIHAGVRGCGGRMLIVDCILCSVCAF
jgi:hypothetical protein